jgi:hypothetical protein
MVSLIQCRLAVRTDWWYCFSHATRLATSSTGVLEGADITAEELWLHFVSIGGQAVELEISAYLHGMMSLSPARAGSS